MIEAGVSRRRTTSLDGGWRVKQAAVQWQMSPLTAFHLPLPAGGQPPRA